MSLPLRQTVIVSFKSDIAAARLAVKEMTAALRFDEQTSEEVVLVASELASNLIKHATHGKLELIPVTTDGRFGIRIESLDNGPGIADSEQAIIDGYSTTGSLGYGLGAVNRLMDELDINLRQEPEGGTRIVCTRWLVVRETCVMPCPLSFGSVTRPHPAMKANGDAFVIKQWGTHALVGVIDAVGHGELAYQVAQTTRQYLENHFDQSMLHLFRGVTRACRGTRGVVMALARFDWAQSKLTFAAIGNIEARVFGSMDPMSFITRRGIIGVNAPNPVVLEHTWEPRYIMVLHSDGLRTRWRWEDFPNFAEAPAQRIAHRLVTTLARADDDATAVVVKGIERRSSSTL
jgi:anti-sigma regulatory factor (Ser/Thr protein kinase)